MVSVRHRGRAQQQHTQKLVLQGIKQTTLEALGGAFSCFYVVLFCIQNTCSGVHLQRQYRHLQGQCAGHSRQVLCDDDDDNNHDGNDDDDNIDDGNDDGNDDDEERWW